MPRTATRAAIDGYPSDMRKMAVVHHLVKEWLPALQEAVSRAADAIEYSSAHGIEAAMNQFNQKTQEP